MAKLVFPSSSFSVVAALLFVAVCYHSIPGGAASAQNSANTFNCTNTVNQSVIVKFVRLCSVLSDIQSLIGKEGKIANISDANNQSVSFRAAVAVSKSVEVNMCNWMNEQVGGDLTKVDDSNNRYCSVEEMNKLCTRMV